jgi:mitogen-activated protein kinase kinase
LIREAKIGEKVLGKLAVSVLKGLAYLHEKKIIHRGISQMGKRLI